MGTAQSSMSNNSSHPHQQQQNSKDHEQRYAEEIGGTFWDLLEPICVGGKRWRFLIYTQIYSILNKKF